jgi:RND family efflux transporter MFP subunit
MNAFPEFPDPEADNAVESPVEAVTDSAEVSHFSRRTGRHLFRVAIAVAIGLSAGFFFVNRSKMAANAKLADATSESVAAPPLVDGVTVKRSSADHTLSLPGATAAWDETAIYARVNGYVAKWFVDIGDDVKAGQTLATISTPELDAELLAARAKLNASVAQVAVRQAQADFARTSNARWRDSPKGVVSDQERADKQAASAAADAELNAAHAQVALEQADVDRLTALTQFKQVKAPFDGIVVERHIDTGNLVTAGSSANTVALYRIAQVAPLRVFVDAPQSAAAQLIDSQVEADVDFGDEPNGLVKGKVSRTARMIDPKSRTLRVEIDLANADHALVPGMYVRVTFKLKGSNGVQVPAAALLFKPEGPEVAVVDKSGVVTFHRVSIASDDGSMVTIRSGLSGGDEVALNLSSQVAPGEIVSLKQGGDRQMESASRTQVQ